tara:strand:+ start:124 stop:528 length:405 start_codon:yes stop_codon:yes gene_type:complete
MKRLHINLAVDDIDNSVKFYTSLFAVEPSVLKEDYAKWMLEDPRVNFAIQTRGAEKGIDHLGIQVEDPDELRAAFDQLKMAEGRIVEEGKTTCCYAKSEKTWIFDPQGVAWETFYTMGESPVYGEDAVLSSEVE